MEDNARSYLAATNEVEQGRPNEQLWAKAVAIEQGDAKRARYTYIQLRVEQFEKAMATSVSPGSSLSLAPSIDAGQRGRIDQVHARDLGDYGDLTEINEAVKKFNWGAALLPFLWAIFNTGGWYWAAALAGNLVIPGVGWLVTGIVFGIFGNRWSWASKNWDSFGAFKRSQMGWTVGGIVFSVMVLVLLVLAGG